MKSGILILALIAATACSSNPSSKSAKMAQTDDPSKGIICTTDQPTGSFLKEKRCTTPEQREAERRQHDTLVDTRNDRGDSTF